MNENIDLTKILKDCPKGTKLYSIIHGEVEFIGISVNVFLLYFACVMSIISACQYFKMNKELIFPKKKMED